MLTWSDLEGHAAAGKLVRWTHNGKPPITGGRALYMVPNVYDALQSKPWPGSDGESPRHTAERRSAMRQVLERFTLGKNMLLNRDVKELGSDPIRENMRGYWEFRSQGRMEETRLFGFFARPGAFVATDFCGRGAFQAQADWEAQKNSCLAAWTSLFPKAFFITSPFPVRNKIVLSKYLNSED